MSSSLRRSASTRDADVEGGAVYDDDIDWTKVKRTPKGKAPPLPLLGAGVCAAWLCLTTARTVGRYEAFVACCVAYGALFSTHLRKWIAKRSGGDGASTRAGSVGAPASTGSSGGNTQLRGFLHGERQGLGHKVLVRPHPERGICRERTAAQGAAAHRHRQQHDGEPRVADLV